MKIAVFHNYYKLRGGEDVMYERECEALRANGHEVIQYHVENYKGISKGSFREKFNVASEAAFSRSSYSKIHEFLRRENPDIGHVHNWFPLLSPSVYYAHSDLEIPVVQTLHNYRMGCASGNFRRKNRNCHLCQPGRTTPAIINRCYRNSLLGSMVWRQTMTRGWKSGTFESKVSHYISPSNEVARMHIEMGLPETNVTVMPNACPDPVKDRESLKIPLQGDVVFLGRLVEDKGVDILIKAWKFVIASTSPHDTPPRLVIAGTGPENESLRRLAEGCKGIRFTGHLTQAAVRESIKAARMLVFPSRWAEPFGLGVIEAMASGRPVIASNQGGPAEIIESGFNGLLVEPEDPRALSRKILDLLDNPAQLMKMGGAARESFQRHYTLEAHAKNLIQLFTRLVNP